jgi:hypothetical protein
LPEYPFLEENKKWQRKFGRQFDGTAHSNRRLHAFFCEQWRILKGCCWALAAKNGHHFHRQHLFKFLAPKSQSSPK